ncbi:MAG TPA: amino acid adenylation domain-containing protein [Anaerolineaceae bacterium]|nr:amino acid adenylation domain-containing protein [Anaerolineaceae bacterium]
MNDQDIEEILPLSPLQQGMLFHSLYAPQSGVYFEQSNWTLSGAIDLNAFQRAWQFLLDRHMALRSTFLWENVDEPLQIVYRSVCVEFVIQDWSSRSQEEQVADLDRFLEVDRQKGFDLAEPPLMRFALLRTAPEKYIFVWSHHHLLLDGWSQPILLQEFSLAYSAFRQGSVPRLPAPYPYSEYIAWLQRQNKTAAETAWREALKGFSTPTPLKIGFPQPGAGEGYTSLKRALSEELSAGLWDLTRRSQITLNTLIQGMWGLLLSRYSGEDDVVFGATVSGRPVDLPGLESMVGMLINTLPVRVQVQPERPCLDWLRDLQIQQSRLRQYEYCSLIDVQGWSEVPRDLPLFETLLVYENYPVDPSQMEVGVIRIQPGSAHAQTNYPLTMAISPGSPIRFVIAYDTSRFDPATISRLVGHFTALLESIAQNPALPIGLLNNLTPAERRLILDEWTATRADFPAHRCVHQLIEEQAARSPQATAVVFQDQAITYTDLDRRANQLAHYLRTHGVGPEVCVAVCLERSIEQVVGLLGIWKAGGAYLPLESRLPQERLAFMLADSSSRILITQESLLSSFSGFEIETMLIDRDWPEIQSQPETVPQNRANPEQLAYIIYTSGSTGQPKGAMLEHRNYVHFITAHKNLLALNPDCTILQFASASFDASLDEIGIGLSSGAKLVLAPYNTLLSAPDLTRLIQEQGITHLLLPPAVIDLLSPDDFSLLRSVTSVGDVCPPQTAARWSAKVQFWNGYGPTETTIGACLGLISPNMEIFGPVPIGYPAANVRIYILDRNLQPLPIGVPGELYIGGAGVGRGYLNRPDLTRERFLADPFNPEPGTRIYKSGDLGRWREDGQIEFLGRLDNQVKIRGLRIELGEIEASLEQHPGLRQGVVLAREDIPGDKRLVAYLVANDTKYPPAINDVRSFLQSRLPIYMVPQAYVFLPALPLLPSGKVNRHALPAPEDPFKDTDAFGQANSTPLELGLAELWREVLGVRQIRPDSHFFEMGGHSLLATRLVSRVRETYEINLPLRDLFEAPTLEGFSTRVNSYLTASNGLKQPPLQRASRSGPTPLSFAQKRLWFLEQLAPGDLSYNLPLAVRLEGDLDYSALQASLNEIVRRHETLRTRFILQNDVPAQDILPELEIPLQRHDLTGTPPERREEDLQNWLKAYSQKPFDLTAGPLLRAYLFELAPQKYVGLMVIHHIISDGWSLGVLLHELTSLYAAYTGGYPSPLAPLPIQYADYTIWQRDWMSGENYEQQLAYWKKQLANLPPLLELPTDLPRQALRSSQGGVVSFRLSAELSRMLEELDKQENVTLFMTLLAAFQVLLARYSGQEDIPVGTAIANRNRAETEGLIGFFVNTQVLRGDLSGEPTFRDLLTRTREACLGAYTHQDLPFENLVEALQPERDLSHTPLFQVMFVLEPPLNEIHRLEKLTITELPVHTGTATFDLTLSCSLTPKGLVGDLEYSADLWDAKTIERMAGHFESLLAAIIRDPDQPIWKIPYLSPEELHQQQVEWNQTQAPAPLDRCAHQLFEAHVQANPDNPALFFEDQVLSYHELNQRANRLARHLQSMGVGPETLVGVSAARSIECIVGILGILKAGGAYLPLDPSYPTDRLAFMIADSGISILLTQAVLQDHLPEFSGNRILLDTVWKEIAGYEAANLPSRASPENLAYAIYTSGSTGKPKGVLLQHHGLCNLVETQRKAFAVQARSRVLQFSSYSFDASVWETFMALGNGGALVLARQEVLASIPDLLHLLQEARVTHATLPPSVLQLLPAASLPDLRVLVAAGEACPAELVNRWAPGRWFFNAYGPTETTVCASMYRCDPGETGLPPIGRPVLNAYLMVVDKHLQPVPVGVPGELLVGGVPLARGYLNRPDLTAERFIHDPFSQDPTTRLYRTGDWVRYRPDGNLEFLGRADHQVKLHGFRIELGEVEAAILQHPGILQAAATIHQDRLDAYIVPAGLPAPSLAELRSFLHKTLPEYMLPGTFTIMETLPLSPSGKVDHRALPAPDSSRPFLEREYVAPRNEIEARLAEIAADLLNLDRVGVLDNFFDLGGHSLLATQFISRVREEFSSELALKVLFEHPRIAELAEDVEKSKVNPVQAPIPVIQPVSRAERRVLRRDLAREIEKGSPPLTEGGKEQ